MIGSIRHKGLRQFFEGDNPRGLTPEHIGKIARILTVLDAANRVEDVEVATFNLHPLKGDLRGYWAVTVRANWRIIFRFEGDQVVDVDLVDYH